MSGWADLDWGQANALDVRYWQALHDACAERTSVGAPEPLSIVARQYFSRRSAPSLRYAHWLRAVVTEMRPFFLRPWSETEGYRAYTEAELFNSALRSIAILPSASDSVLWDWGGWMRKVKSVLDLYIISSPLQPIESLGVCLGGSQQTMLHQSLASAISEAIARTTNTAWSGSYYRSAGRTWQCSRFRPNHTDPDRYNAGTTQYHGVRVSNAAPITGIPLVVAASPAGGVYDAVGSTWQEGVNVLDPLAATDDVILDAGGAADPDTAPTLPAPADGETSNANIGYSLRLYYDWRTPGGFVYYT